MIKMSFSMQKNFSDVEISTQGVEESEKKRKELLNG